MCCTRGIREIYYESHKSDLFVSWCVQLQLRKSCEFAQQPPIDVIVTLQQALLTDVVSAENEGYVRSDNHVAIISSKKHGDLLEVELSNLEVEVLETSTGQKSRNEVIIASVLLGGVVVYVAWKYIFPAVLKEVGYRTPGAGDSVESTKIEDVDSVVKTAWILKGKTLYHVFRGPSGHLLFFGGVLPDAVTVTRNGQEFHVEGDGWHVKSIGLKLHSYNTDCNCRKVLDPEEVTTQTGTKKPTKMHR